MKNTKDQLRVCTRCIYDSNVPNITFDENGICNYCHQIDSLAEEYQTGKPEGEAELSKILNRIKKEGRKKKYDCVIGVSGGTDSSFLLLKAIEWGLRPLAVHYDNTWNSAIATENIRKVTKYLDVDLYTYVINNAESDDIYRSFFLAGVPEFDACTDIAFIQVLRSVAAKFKVKYIIEGHSFTAEGVSPMAKNYFDGKYIKSVHSRFGRRGIPTYPNLTFFRFMRWTLFHKQEIIRPLWYMSYFKEDARKILEEKTGWKYYGGHHLENRATSFTHTVYYPRKFGIDNRNLSLSAEVRSGVKSREDALAEYSTPIADDTELIKYVKKRLELSDGEYLQTMNGPKRSFRDFKTYKRLFEILRPLFYLLAKSNRVPKSFYIKYCFPLENEK